MRITVGSNVDASHELQIEHLKYEGIEHIGLPMLCPNPALEYRRQSGGIAKTAAEVAG